MPVLRSSVAATGLRLGAAARPTAISRAKQASTISAGDAKTARAFSIRRRISATIWTTTAALTMWAAMAAETAAAKPDLHAIAPRFALKRKRPLAGPLFFFASARWAGLQIGRGTAAPHSRTAGRAAGARGTAGRAAAAR